MSKWNRVQRDISILTFASPIENAIFKTPFILNNPNSRKTPAKFEIINCEIDSWQLIDYKVGWLVFQDCDIRRLILRLSECHRLTFIRCNIESLHTRGSIKQADFHDCENVLEYTNSATGESIHFANSRVEAISINGRINTFSYEQGTTTYLGERLGIQSTECGSILLEEDLDVFRLENAKVSKEIRIDCTTIGSFIINDSSVRNLEFQDNQSIRDRRQCSISNFSFLRTTLRGDLNLNRFIKHEIKLTECKVFGKTFLTGNNWKSIEVSG